MSKPRETSKQFSKTSSINIFLILIEKFSHVPTVSMSKQLERKTDSFWKRDFYWAMDNYSTNVDVVMNNLKVGMVRFNKQIDRENQFSIYQKLFK